MATLPGTIGNGPAPQSGGAVVGYQPPRIGVGEAVSRAGRDVEETAAIVAQMNERQDMLTAQGVANRLQAAAIDLQHNEKTGFVNVKGGNAVGPNFVSRFEDQFKGAREELRNTLANDNQKRAFDTHADVQAMHFKGSLLQHQAVQTSAFNNETENDTINLARRQMFANPGDPGAMQGAFSQINWAIDQKAQRLGWSPATVAATKQEYAAKVFDDMTGLAVERDPAGAYTALDARLRQGKSGVAYVDGLEPHKLVEYHHRAAAYVQAQQNRQNTADEQLLRIAEDAVKRYTDLTLTGVPISAEGARELRALTSKTPLAAQGEALISASLLGSTFGTKSLPEQAKTLRAADAEIAKSGTEPEAAKLLNRMREIHSNQVAAYKENPWAASARFARMPEVPEQPGAPVADLVKQRTPLMAGVEAAAGQPVSPLQPNEARAYTERLKALAPADAAKELGQVGAALTLPRLEAFADQIDKQDKPMALALKLGTDGTTAGRPVGELVLRGAQALKDKAVKRDDTVLTGWRTEIASLVRGTLGDAKAEEDAIEAAYYIRAALDFDGAAAPGFKFDRSIESAVRFAVGQPIERNGVKTILPREMDESIFDAKLKTFTPDVVRSMAPNGLYVRGRPITPEFFSSSLERLGMRRDGRGNFVPSSGGAFVTLDAAGQVPLRLPMR